MSQMPDQKLKDAMYAEFEATMRGMFVPPLVAQCYRMAHLEIEEMLTGYTDPDLAVWRVMEIMRDFPDG